MIAKTLKKLLVKLTMMQIDTPSVAELVKPKFDFRNKGNKVTITKHSSFPKSSFWKSLNKFNSPSEALVILQLGQSKEANILSKIPGSALYKKECINPHCGRTFESTIRGLYCNYGAGGKEGSACRVNVKRMKMKAEEYLINYSFLLIIGAFILINIVGHLSRED